MANRRTSLAVRKPKIYFCHAAFNKGKIVWFFPKSKRNEVSKFPKAITLIINSIHVQFGERPPAHTQTHTKKTTQNAIF